MDRKLAIPVFLLGLAFAGLCRADVVTLGRIAVLAVLLLAVVCIRGKDVHRYAYFTGCMLAVFVYLSRIASPRQPALGLLVSWSLNVLVLLWACGWCLLARKRVLGRPGAAPPLSRIENWVLLCGCGLGFYAFITHGQGSSHGLGRIGGAVLAWISVFNIGALLVLLPKTLGRPVRARVTAGLMILACASALGVFAARYCRLERVLDQASAEFQAKKFTPSWETLRKAMDQNLLLQSHALSDRIELLKTDLTASSGKYSEALDHVLDYLRLVSSLGFRKPAAKADFDSYFQRAPLQPLLGKRNTRDRRQLFDRLHSSMDRRAALAEKMHYLFLKNGFLDRLRERYASAGLPPISDVQAFASALSQAGGWRLETGDWRLEEKQKKEISQAYSLQPTAYSLTEAEYLKGAILYQSGDRDGAEKAFRNVLAAQPEHANAISLLERIAADRHDKDALSRLQARLRRIANPEMTGNHSWGLNLLKILWCPFEVNPGRYEIEMEMRGQPAAGVWPEICVFLDDSAQAVFRGSVESRIWTAARFTLSFPRPGWHRLLLSFENDYTSVSAQGVKEDRNLELRQLTIRYYPAEPSRKSN
jgi:tetratricopeptide (TPR) repeat protein